MATTEEPQIREKTSGPCVKQFSVFLLNRVGALLEIVRMLNESDGHVLALNSQDSTDSALVRLVVSEPDALENNFDLNEITYSIPDIFVVEMREVAVGLRKRLQCLLRPEG